MRIHPDCGYAYRDSGGDCSDQPVILGDGSERPLIGQETEATIRAALRRRPR